MQPDIITPSSAEAKAPNIPSEQPGKATEANDATSPQTVRILSQWILRIHLAASMILY